MNDLPLLFVAELISLEPAVGFFFQQMVRDLAHLRKANECTMNEAFIHASSARLGFKDLTLCALGQGVSRGTAG